MLHQQQYLDHNCLPVRRTQRPVRHLMPAQPLAVDVLGQDVDAERRQRDASVAEGFQEPADEVGCGVDHAKLQISAATPDQKASSARPMRV